MLKATPLRCQSSGDTKSGAVNTIISPFGHVGQSVVGGYWMRARDDIKGQINLGYFLPARKRRTFTWYVAFSRRFRVFVLFTVFLP